MTAVLEAVPNFSEGRDLDVVRGIVAAVEAEGAEVLDWSADPDHHRAVVTYIGGPETVERASVAAARRAYETIDLRTHRGLHPRIGALDVLPFVPLAGMEMDDAVRSARRVGRELADAGVPVYWYARAADPPGRGLAEIRRGGFEALVEGWEPDREPDLVPEGWEHPGIHPSSGATCVGAREVLLAWNVFVEGVDPDDAREIAGEIREAGGGFPSLRALAFALPDDDRVQISMNLEDPEGTAPDAVFEAIRGRVEARGGAVVGTEVIGMLPDPLVLTASAARLGLLDPSPRRLLSRRVASHLAARDGARPDGGAPSSVRERQP